MNDARRQLNLKDDGETLAAVRDFADRANHVNPIPRNTASSIARAAVRFALAHPGFWMLYGLRHPRQEAPAPPGRRTLGRAQF